MAVLADFLCACDLVENMMSNLVPAITLCLEHGLVNVPSA